VDELPKSLKVRSDCLAHRLFGNLLARDLDERRMGSLGFEA